MNSLDQIITPNVKSDRTSVYAQYSIRVKERHALITHLNAYNIPTAIHYSTPIHLQNCLAFLGHTLGDFPICECITDEILSLPMSAYLTDLQLSTIVRAIRDFFQNQQSLNEQVHC